MLKVRATITTLSLGASLVSFLAYTHLIRSFGAGSTIDGFFAAANMPAAISGLCSAALYYVLPPALVKQARVGRIELVVGLSLKAILFIAVGLVALCVVALLRQGELDGPPGSLESSLLTATFVVVAGLSIAQTCAATMANTDGRYTAAAVSGFTGVFGLAIGSILATRSSTLVLMPAFQSIGLAIGLVVGFGSSVKVIPAALGRAWSNSFAFLKGFGRSWIWILGGAAAFSTFPAIDLYIAPIAGEGALTIVTYGQKLMVAAGTFVSFGAHAISAKEISEIIKARGLRSCLRYLTIDLRRCIAIGLSLSIAFWLVGAPLLAIVFSQRSVATEHLSMLHGLLSLMLIGVGAMALVPIFFRVMYSLGTYRLAALFGFGVPVIYSIVSYALVHGSGIRAFGYAYAATWGLTAFVIWAWLTRRAKRDPEERPGSTDAKSFN